MRTRPAASARVRSLWLLDRQLQLRFAVLLPAVVATATAMQAPAALALGSEPARLEKRSLVAAHPHLSGAAAVLPPRCEGAHPNAFALALASFARDFRASEPAMVEGAWPHCRGPRQPQSNWRLASLDASLPEPRRSEKESGWSIRWRASSSCLAAPLRDVLERVADEFGPLTVNSTCRSRRHNARVGGASRSFHLIGRAVDFRIHGNHRKVLRFLKRQRSVGGYAHYGRGVFHIDTGPRRTWGPGSWRRARG